MKQETIDAFASMAVLVAKELSEKDEEIAEWKEAYQLCLRRATEHADRCCRMEEKLRRYEFNNIPTGDKCTECGAVLLLSAREIGDGLCHYCAHQRLPDARDEIADLQQSVVSATEKFAKAAKLINEVLQVIADSGLQSPTLKFDIEWIHDAEEAVAGICCCDEVCCDECEED
jgi:hypothetical protein